MDLDVEPVFAAALEDRARFLDRIVAVVAIDVVEFGQPETGDLGDHLVEDFVDIRVAALVVGEFMRAEEGRDDLDRLALAEQAIDLQHLDLGRRVEPVSALALHRGGAAGQHVPQALGRALGELLLAGFAHHPGRGGDAHGNAHGLDLGRAAAAHLLRILLDARLVEDEMRVAVDQGRRDEPVAAIFDSGAAPFGRHHIGPPDPGDAAVFDADRALGDEAAITLPLIATAVFAQAPTRSGASLAQVRTWPAFSISAVILPIAVLQKKTDGWSDSVPTGTAPGCVPVRKRGCPARRWPWGSTTAAPARRPWRSGRPPPCGRCRSRPGHGAPRRCPSPWSGRPPA